MSARTDRIAKLAALIPQLTAANQPNKAQTMRDKMAKFEAMCDADYDWFIANAEAILATGKGWVERNASTWRA